MTAACRSNNGALATPTLCAFVILTTLLAEALSFGSVTTSLASTSIYNNFHGSNTQTIASRRCASPSNSNNDDDDDRTNRGVSTSGPTNGRRQALRSATAVLMSGIVATRCVVDPAWAASDAPVPIPPAVEGGTTTNLYTTKSGLKYIDLKVGTGASIRYGQLVSISYKAFIKLPTKPNGEKTEPEKYDADNAYLLKHGNGRQVPGLDEGLHTMRVGGIRRIIVPPKLGYVVGGLGPLPVSPLDRKKLNRLLDGMVESRGGQVIFDVELRTAMDDEADQGYYEDKSLNPDDFEILKENLQRSAREAREAERVKNQV